MQAKPFGCYLVEKDTSGDVRAGLSTRPFAELPAGEVLVRVLWSGAELQGCAGGARPSGRRAAVPAHPGHRRRGNRRDFPVPRNSNRDRRSWSATYDLGSGRWGAWADYLRVPAEWVMPLPEGLSPRETIILGTAGFTASLCVATLQSHGVRPENGEVVVSGASGGVGCLAVQLLAKLGYSVVAISGKPACREWLQSWGRCAGPVARGCGRCRSEASALRTLGRLRSTP